MAAGTYLITIEQGTTFRRKLIWKDPQGNPQNLTGWTARLQARQSIDASTAYLDLTTENGGIVLNGPLGEINLFLAAADTNDITISSGVYDLELERTDDGEVIRILQGKIKMKKGVTR